MQDEPRVGVASPLIQLSNNIQSQTTWKSGLEGKLLTFADATFANKEQREAVKSILKQIVHEHYRESCLSICYEINDFSDVFEGEKIEYTKFDSPNGSSDCRSLILRSTSYKK